MTYCIPFDDEACNGDAIDLVGGKNASLGELTSVGAQVPPGFAVTTEFYEDFLAATGLDEIIEERLQETDLGDATETAAAGEDIRAAIRAESFPAELDDALKTAWEQLQETCGQDDLEVAIRSSATAEDLPDASFAGQQDTYLGVSGLDNVKERVRDCIASLFTARAISYRQERGFDHNAVLISVGVQKLVDARSSGVMFTLNTANGDRSKVRIESSWGLGEAVVAGEVTPDSFLVDKPIGNIVERTISTKRVKTARSESEVETVEIPEEQQEEVSVTDNEIERLTEHGREIEKHYGRPQDIEWAIEGPMDGDSSIYILQSRPETTWNDEGSEEKSPDDNSDESSDSSGMSSVMDMIKGGS